MAKQEKYKVNVYSRLNQCSRRKTAFSIRQQLHPKVTTNPFALFLSIFFSSRLEPKRKKTAPREDSVRMHHETLTPLRFSSKISPEHKHSRDTVVTDYIYTSF